MPYILTRPHKRFIAPLAAALALMVAASPAAADPGCAAAPSSPVFAQFGDTASYTPLAGGTFEGDMAGWSLNGASVVSGNESFYVNSATDSHSLSIASNGVALSPTFCVDATDPTLRLFAQKLSGGTGRLRVDILYASPNNGHQMAATAGYVIQGYANATGDYTNWAPSLTMNLATALPLWKTDNGQLPVQLRFTANADPGAWAIDDVYIDPYAK
jgi:hypothetical protein